MTLLKIASMGHPVLRQVADPVADPQDPEIARLAADMIETMKDAPGIGLAAPQIYRPLRLIVFVVPPGRQEEGEPAGPDGPTVLINPEIEPAGEDRMVELEGCLSIPGLRGLVPRWRQIVYRGIGLDGRPIEREAMGLHARVVQHEVDHLDGVLYLDRLRDLNDLAFESEAHYLADRA